MNIKINIKLNLMTKCGESDIINKKIGVKLSNVVRYQLFKVMNEYDEIFYLNDETNWNYTKYSSEYVLEDINKFYIPKHYVNNELVEIKEFKDFQEGTPPSTVFDAIESFNRYTTKYEKFEKEINTIFKLNNISIELRRGEIYLINNKSMELDSSIRIGEVGIEELITIANELYREGKYSYAVEKIWDAYERIKTYYYPSLDKKKSVEKIIEDISYGNENIKNMFDIEFKALTKIGNSYRIRHHEKNKIDISKELHYKYFYKRCFTLISVIIENLK